MMSDNKDVTVVSELRYDEGEDSVQAQKGGTTQDALDMSRMGKKQQLQVCRAPSAAPVTSHEAGTPH